MQSININEKILKGLKAFLGGNPPGEYCNEFSHISFSHKILDNGDFLISSFGDESDGGRFESRVFNALTSELDRWKIKSKSEGDLKGFAFQFSTNQLKAMSVISYLQLLFKDSYVRYEFDEKVENVKIYAAKSLMQQEGLVEKISNLNPALKLAEHGATADLSLFDLLQEQEIPDAIYCSYYKTYAAQDPIRQIQYNVNPKDIHYDDIVDRSSSVIPQKDGFWTPINVYELEFIGNGE